MKIIESKKLLKTLYHKKLRLDFIPTSRFQIIPLKLKLMQFHTKMKRMFTPSSLSPTRENNLLNKLWTLEWSWKLWIKIFQLNHKFLDNNPTIKDLRVLWEIVAIVKFNLQLITLQEWNLLCTEETLTFLSQDK